MRHVSFLQTQVTGKIAILNLKSSSGTFQIQRSFVGSSKKKKLRNLANELNDATKENSSF